MASRQHASNSFLPIVHELSTGSTTTVASSGGNVSSTSTPKNTSKGNAASPQQLPQQPSSMRSDSSGSAKGAGNQGTLPFAGAQQLDNGTGSSNSRNSRTPSGGVEQRRSPSMSQKQQQRTGGISAVASHPHQQQYDYAQTSTNAVPTSFREQYHQHQHPFQHTGGYLHEQDAGRWNGSWNGMPANSSHAELLLMMSSTQDSISDEGGFNGRMESESGYGSIQHPSRRGRRDSARPVDPNDSTSSPLLGAALTSFNDLEAFGQRQQFAATANAFPTDMAVVHALSRYQQQHQQRHFQQQQQQAHHYQTFPESVFVSHFAPPNVSAAVQPPPPPPLVSATTHGKPRSTWSHASRHQQPPSPKDHHAFFSSTYADPRQQEEIALFASLATPSQSDYVSPHGPIQTTSNHRIVVPHSPQYFVSPKGMDSSLPNKYRDNDGGSSEQPSTVHEFEDLDEYSDDHRDDHEEADKEHDQDLSCWDVLSESWSHWLCDGVKWDDSGAPYFDDDNRWTSISAWVRFIVFNPVYPEFTSVQQAFWAVFIGVVIGIFTALWKMIIDACVDFMWKTIPETLLRYGILTDLTGRFPMPYYVVLCPAVCGCILSYINVIIPVKIPGQNEWIRDVHSRGVHDAQPFWYMFGMSTMAMASGMSLGPEGPLVTVGGMFGSKLGLITKQSVLQARVLNLTAASATVGGFFGFPMAGALFVLELPHRMGLQYFEALTPATVATIVAVLTNRMVMKNDVTGYFSYPFMNTTLPSRIFVNAICYGAFGAFIGILYAKGVSGLKIIVHDLFHASDHPQQHGPPPNDNSQPAIELTHDDRRNHSSLGEESLPLVGDSHSNTIDVKRNEPGTNLFDCFTLLCKCTIPHEPTRAAVVGTMAGATVGLIGMFLPHIMFWGEAQLQSLIDKGRTPLPVFVQEDESISDLAAYGRCMIDPKDPQAVSAGFGMGCSSVLVFAKILCTGLSMGTGIAGGHFWGPLFCGCAASHFLTDLTSWTHKHWGLGGQIAAYPCVSLLCVMGSTHVVTFRAHTAIALILTLTISAFHPENEVGAGSYKVAGDYSAVFPLLVVAVYVSFILARDVVFYKEQRSRGDIVALPEVLCEPGKVGQPLVVNYDGQVESQDDDRDHDHEYPHRDGDPTGRANQLERNNSPSPPKGRIMEQKDSDDGFEVKTSFSSSQHDTTQSGLEWDVSKDSVDPSDSKSKSTSREAGHPRRLHSDMESYLAAPRNDDETRGADSRLDELLSQPLDQSSTEVRSFHRRTQSAPIEQLNAPPVRRRKLSKHRGNSSRDVSNESQVGSQRERSSSGSGRALVRVTSFGEVTNHQPSLLDQARRQSATNAAPETRHHRLPSLPKVSTTSSRHSRWGSDPSSIVSATMASVEASTGALTSDDIERTFSSVVNHHFLQQHG